MTIGQTLGVIGVTGTAATAALAGVMQQRARAIQSGAFVRENLASHNIPDVWAPYIVSRGRFSRAFGMRTTSGGVERPHSGIDICGPQGAIVYAMRSGLVEHSGQTNGYGEAILIRHVDGSTALYAHMNERGVQQGALVQGGSPIGIMGRTSNTGSMPADPQIQGSPRVIRQNPIRTQDPRCSRFPSMGIHIHFSIHGVQTAPLDITPPKEPLPHSSIFWRNISTDLEARHGIDPIPYLGAHGVRVSAQEVAACPQWSPNWSIA